MMMNRIVGIVILCIFFIPLPSHGKQDALDGKTQRAYYVQTLIRIADPVLDALSKNELKKRMPLEAKYPDTRRDFMHLEAFGRLLAGMAPWLELGADETEEGKLRKKYIDLSVTGIHNATDPESPDFMNFTEGKQPLVDAAFLAQALLRAPDQLWGNLTEKTKENVLEALRSTRGITPGYNNWLLFSAIIEAALQQFDGSGDLMRIDYGVRQMLAWYKGDGAYGDGPEFHWDYYNSFVIQPMLIEILQVLKDHDLDPANNYDLVLKRASRYAAVQERLISPEGTYPLLGRSIPYRFGAFQLLSKVAHLNALPVKVKPQQVRYALYTVIKKQIEAPGTFDEKGWLRIGFYGHQPELAENYICTGSLYLCSQAFLVLGLPPSDAFWTGANIDWTAKAVYEGKSAPIDKALRNNGR